MRFIDVFLQLFVIALLAARSFGGMCGFVLMEQSPPMSFPRKRESSDGRSERNPE
jgi:hypothetical protein